MLQMSSMMRGGAGGDMAGFPAPGLPSSAAGASQDTEAGASGAGNTAALPPIPPFFNSFFPPSAGGASGTNANASSAEGLSPAGQFPASFDAAAHAMRLMGGGGFGGFGAPAAAAPADTRPPEERFQVQLEVRQELRDILSACGLRTSHVATTRHGFLKRVPEHTGFACDRWQRPSGNRIYPGRRRTLI